MGTGPAHHLPPRNEPDHAGRMTTVMRAMPVVASEPRVVRVGVLHGGRVVEERIVRQHVTVTVGSSEEAMFVIPSPGAPLLHALFERVGDAYWLDVVDGMTGRIALEGGRITDLPPGSSRTKLDDEARGKIVIGSTTILFQLVEPLRVQPRPQLPLAVRGGLASTNDWSLTFIAAFSFLVHFGLVGAMYSDWSDPIVAERFDVAGLVDMMGRVPPPPVEVADQSNTSASTTQPPQPHTLPAPREPLQTTSSPARRSSPVDAHRTSNTTADDARSAVLAARAETMQMQTIASLEGGPAVADALKRSNIPGVDLTTIAERNAGATHTGSDLVVHGGGDPVRASHTGGLSVLGGPIRSEGVGKTSGKETAVAGPTGVAQIGATDATVTVPNADSVIASLRGRFRSCYQKGLLDDSTMSGKVTIRAKVGPNGEVTSADIASSSGLSPTVGRCIADVVKRATFSAPGASGSTLQIPVTFVQSK